MAFEGNGSVSLNVPEKRGESYGAWITHGNGDVHCYIMNGSAVIGTNKDHKDKVDFSDMALVVNKDEINFQYADDAGKPHHAKVTADQWKEAVLNMLHGLKLKVNVTEVIK